MKKFLICALIIGTSFFAPNAFAGDTSNGLGSALEIVIPIEGDLITAPIERHEPAYNPQPNGDHVTRVRTTITLLDPAKQTQRITVDVWLLSMTRDKDEYIKFLEDSVSITQVDHENLLLLGYNSSSDLADYVPVPPKGQPKVGLRKDVAGYSTQVTWQSRYLSLEHQTFLTLGVRVVCDETDADSRNPCGIPSTVFSSPDKTAVAEVSVRI